MIMRASHTVEACAELSHPLECFRDSAGEGKRHGQCDWPAHHRGEPCSLEYSGQSAEGILTVFTGVCPPTLCPLPGGDMLLSPQNQAMMDDCPGSFVVSTSLLGKRPMAYRVAHPRGMDTT